MCVISSACSKKGKLTLMSMGLNRCVKEAIYLTRATIFEVSDVQLDELRASSCSQKR